MTRHVIEIFLAECEPWLPPGLSSNGRSISPWLQILIFLYYVTGAIPFCHLAVAAGLKKSTRQKIIRKVVNSLIDNGFVTRWITRITEVLHWLMNHVKQPLLFLLSILGGSPLRGRTLHQKQWNATNLPTCCRRVSCGSKLNCICIKILYIRVSTICKILDYQKAVQTT